MMQIGRGYGEENQKASEPERNRGRYVKRGETNATAVPYPLPATCANAHRQMGAAHRPTVRSTGFASTERPGSRTHWQHSPRTSRCAAKADNPLKRFGLKWMQR